MLDTAALLIALTALLGVVNERLLRLPQTIGVMVLSLGLSLILLLLDRFGWDTLTLLLQERISAIDFGKVLLHGMLSFLLFAGALHVDLESLARQRWVVAVLASAGVVASTLLIGVAAWWLFNPVLGLPLPLTHCLLLGALLSPTDPIAVLSVLRTANAPISLEIKIVGESLFNDGVAVVVFSIFLTLAFSADDVTGTEVTRLLVQEVGGGALYGLALGYLGYRLARASRRFDVQILVTLALVFGGYMLALHLHVSGPIAVVVAGLLVGYQRHRRQPMSHQPTRLDELWETIDETLNAVLFVLIGLEVLVLHFDHTALLAGLLTIPLMLVARGICVGAPVALLRAAGHGEFSPHAIKLLTWGGIRGGISVALALSLPAGPERDLILTVTYIVVVFSILVQGLTLGPVVRWALRHGAS